MNALAELKRKNARMVRQLRRTHAELDHFVRALSHDMSANFMLLEDSFSRLRRLLGQSPPAELREPIAHVDACLAESKRFLDDLVLLARTGSVQMEPERVDVAAVVDEVVFEQQEPLAMRGIAVDARRPLPIVWCNRQRVKQILSNLIRNAIKHGCDPRRPRIAISSPKATAAGRMASIRVHDNGPGIAGRHTEAIFLPGRRLHGGSEEGSGMGLAIVRKIAEHYGGAVWVDSHCTDGTAIIFRLPTAPELAAPVGGTAPPVGHNGPHPGSPPEPHGTFRP